MPLPGIKRRARRSLGAAWGAARASETQRDTLLALAEYMHRLDDRAPRPAGPLAASELRVFSQNGEDGVLAECLRRIGPGSGTFAEFGAGTGTENNCMLLADVLGWSGVFIDGNPDSAARLQRKYAGVPGVRAVQAILQSSTIDRVLRDAGVPDDVDVLSIDVDGADYWLWAAIEGPRPRVVVIEYNGSLGPDLVAVQPEAECSGGENTDHFGASIQALVELGAAKGYRLVHTELTGANAFFVREDLGGDWPDPGDVPRRGANYFLNGRGHPPEPAPRPYVRPVASDVVARRA